MKTFSPALFPVIFISAAALICTTGCEQEIAAGGSPLYGRAVRESIAGLQGGAHDKPAQANAPCPNCGKVHPPAGSVSTNEVAGAAAAHNHAPPDPALYVYCANCKAYHPRQQEANKPTPAASPGNLFWGTNNPPSWLKFGT